MATRLEGDMPETLFKLTIDGKEVVAPKGMNLIEAAKLAGIEVPHYCYHPKLAVEFGCEVTRIACHDHPAFRIVAEQPRNIGD